MFGRSMTRVSTPVKYATGRSRASFNTRRTPLISTSAPLNTTCVRDPLTRIYPCMKAPHNKFATEKELKQRHTYGYCEKDWTGAPVLQLSVRREWTQRMIAPRKPDPCNKTYLKMCKFCPYECCACGPDCHQLMKIPEPGECSKCNWKGNKSRILYCTL